MRSKWLAPIVIALMLIFTLVVYNQLPAQLPIHWNVNGQVDRTADRIFGALMAPGVALLIWVMMRVVPSLDPRREAYKLFASTYDTLINLFVIFFGVIHVLTLGTGLGWDIPVAQVVMVGVGLLIAFLGNQLGRVQPNWFVGIRTPWTLSDPDVWKQTHRLGGRTMFFGGLLAAVVGIIIPLPIVAVVFMAIILGSSLAPIVYSYIVWQRLHRNQVNGQS